MKLLHALIASAISSFVFIVLKKKIDGLLMNVFRDLSRFKSRKSKFTLFAANSRNPSIIKRFICSLGLYGKDAALIPILLGLEKPVKTKIEDLLENAASISAEELAENDGRTETTPIYVAVNGHVYDVSASRDKYGPGGKYHALAGHDASIAFATACYEPKCLVGTLGTLSESQKKDLIKWDELYAQHDQYTFVGVLANSDPVGDSVDQALKEQHSEATTGESASEEPAETTEVEAEPEPVQSNEDAEPVPVEEVATEEVVEEVTDAAAPEASVTETETETASEPEPVAVDATDNSEVPSQEEVAEE